MFSTKFAAQAAFSCPGGVILVPLPGLSLGPFGAQSGGGQELARDFTG
ncbi:MAG: hypothetical protein AB1426_04585 [Bacillota bacterium]